MAEAKPSRKKPMSKPKCVRCGNQHTVSALGHWHDGWWTCSVVQRPLAGVTLLRNPASACRGGL